MLSTFLARFEQQKQDPRYVRGNQFPHAQKGVLQHQTHQPLVVLVLGHQLNAHGSAQALPVNHNIIIASLGASTQVLEGGLRVNHEAGLVRGSGRQAITTVFKHQHAAPDSLYEHARDGDAVADVSRVAVEHQDGDVPAHARLWGADEEGRELLAVGRRDHQLFEVADAELRGSRHFGASIVWDVRGVNQSSAKVGGDQRVFE